jgi:hypothetical protein
MRKFIGWTAATLLLLVGVAYGQVNGVFANISASGIIHTLSAVHADVSVNTSDVTSVTGEFAGQVTGSPFVGPLTGNATSATTAANLAGVSPCASGYATGISVSGAASGCSIDYYWDQGSTCTPAIGNGQSCTSTLNLPGPMPDVGYALQCNVFVISGPASIAGGGIATPQTSWPTTTGGSFQAFVNVIQQNSETIGPNTGFSCHAHHS